MLSNAIIGGLFSAFVIFHFFQQRAWTAERQRMLDAVISRNSSEFAHLQKSSTPTVNRVVEDAREYPIGL